MTTRIRPFTGKKEQLNCSSLPRKIGREKREKKLPPPTSLSPPHEKEKEDEYRLPEKEGRKGKRRTLISPHSTTAFPPKRREEGEVPVGERGRNLPS